MTINRKRKANQKTTMNQKIMIQKTSSLNFEKSVIIMNNEPLNNDQLYDSKTRFATKRSNTTKAIIIRHCSLLISLL